MSVDPDVSLWRASIQPAELRRVGRTPDYRFSLANERTFLAWLRTALALVGGGVAVAEFVSPLTVPHLREAIAVTMIVLGAACALRGVSHWLRCERAMRTDDDLPMSRFPVLLATVVAVAAAGLLTAVFFGVFGS